MEGKRKYREHTCGTSKGTSHWRVCCCDEKWLLCLDSMLATVVKAVI